MKFKSVLDERRNTITGVLASEIKNLPSIEKIIDSHYLPNGVAVFARSKDGNAYEFIMY